jgi:hypothetical protein
MARRFPPPWRAEKMPGGYVVRDANGQDRDSEAEAMQDRGHLEKPDAGGLKKKSCLTNVDR